MVRQKYKLIASRDTDDRRILESDWTRGRLSQSRLGVVVLDAIFT